MILSLLAKLFPQLCLCNGNGLKQDLVIHNVVMNDVHNVILDSFKESRKTLMMKSHLIPRYFERQMSYFFVMNDKQLCNKRDGLLVFYLRN